MEIICEREEELPSIAEKIVNFAGEKKVWLLIGEMGSGKTTFVKALGSFFTFEDQVSSPSFSIVNEYEDAGGTIYYHFDFYRIKNETEAMDIGTDDYFYSGNYCFIEWPEKVSNLVPAEYLTIEIEQTSLNNRKFNITHHD